MRAFIGYLSGIGRAAGLLLAGLACLVTGSASALDPKRAISQFHHTVWSSGVDILSAQAGGGLVSLDGTSMACPHVAGAAALWWQALSETGSQTPDNVAAHLIGRADPTALLEEFGADLRGAGLVTCPSRGIG